MCFSKEASYFTGSILVAIGSYTILSNKQKKLLPAACIPLFFGIQQLAEGSLWASLEVGLPVEATLFTNLTNINNFSALFFLLFAFFIWPIWIPLSALLPEKIPARQKLLKAILLLGIITGGISVLSLTGNVITLKIIENSIQYLPERALLLPVPLFLTFYGLSVITPSIISTTKGFSIFGITSLTTLIISYYIYFNSFTSNWCFFSAWLSILVVMIIKAGNEEANALAKQYVKKD